MTAHDTNLSDTPATQTGGTPDSTVTPASRDTATVIVWRISPDPVDDADAARNSDAGDSPLTPRLAHHLVAIYSDEHATVVDFDADLHLRHAAEAAGRTYTSITDNAGPGPGELPVGPATLILLRWPRPDTEGPLPDANGLLSRCQQHLTADGSTIVVVTTGQPGATGASYHDHEQLLLPAAHSAGLRHLHDIVPISAEDGRDAFTYATDKRTAERTGPGDKRHDAVTTLMIFGHPGTAVTPHDSSDRQPTRGRQQDRPVPVTRDTQAEPGDRNLSPGDRDEQPSHQTHEPRYGATPNIPLTRSAREGEQTDGPLGLSDLGAQ